MNFSHDFYSFSAYFVSIIVSDEHTGPDNFIRLGVCCFGSGFVVRCDIIAVFEEVAS